jgi:hypothetical protein
MESGRKQSVALGYAFGLSSQYQSRATAKQQLHADHGRHRNRHNGESNAYSSHR